MILRMMWNSHDRFGTLSKALHWGGATLIFAMIGLGVWAVKAPLETPEEMAAKWELFALHKTIGVCAFLFGGMRLIAMALQLKPDPLASHRPAEVFAARTAHWLLTLLMMLVPLAGWVRHASLPGFAPLHLPFGDSLPFVPADPQFSETASTLHFAFVALLVGTVALHMAGALKHHFFDRDATLRRMLPGAVEAPQTKAASRAALPPILAAVVISGVALIAIAAAPAP